jgi:uncharacterized delta-60 repeat protein
MSRRSFLRAPVAAVLAACTIAVFATPAAAAPGDLDTTFSDDGIATTAANQVAFAEGVAVTPSGKVVVAGTDQAASGPGSSMLVVEYNASGRLDHHFGGGDGIEELDLGQCTQGRAIALDDQGRIVVAGVRQNCTTSNTVIVLARFLPDGSLDHAFGGGDGWTVTSLKGNGEYAAGVAVDGSKIVVAGGVIPSGSTRFHFLVLRYSSNGTLDHSFHGNGIAIASLGTRADEGLSVAVQPDHAIVACGLSQATSFHDRFAVVRYLATGDLDTTFSGDGKLTVGITAGFDDCQSVALDAGKIVLGGAADADQAADFALVRLTASGHPDPSFGSSGRVTLSLSPGEDEVQGVAVDDAGRIVAAGWRDGFNNPRFGLARFLDDGTPDASFGNAGIVTTKIEKRSNANAVALAGDTIVVAGQTNDPDDDVAVARYLA